VGELTARGLKRLLALVCEDADNVETRSLLAAGARGMVHRDQLTGTLLPTIEAMRAGQVCFPARNASAFRRPVLSTARNSDRSRA
jgi:DNA-binding NarL/FixJ family response regulator